VRDSTPQALSDGPRASCAAPLPPPPAHSDPTSSRLTPTLALPAAVESEFEKYMPHFRPFLCLGLNNYEEHQVCAVAVGVVGDICRALEVKVLPYCEEILQLLLRNLQNPALNRNVKPPILSCFGDIALAVGGNFEAYLQATMSMLEQAGMTAMDVSNPDLVDYLGQLREGIFEAYTGVLQGLRADNKGPKFTPYLQGAMRLLHQVALPPARGADCRMRWDHGPARAPTRWPSRAATTMCRTTSAAPPSASSETSR